MSDVARPFPPGRYPVVVVGSGPGGLQLSYDLKRLGIDHALLSADAGPGGMFRKWPLFQRLLSWTKPFAADGPGSPRFERVDWNSLLADEPELRALQAKHMDGASYFPSRAEMEANLKEFAQRAAIEARYGCVWESTALVEDGSEDRFALTTSDGEYRCKVAVFAVGIAEPWSPNLPGIEHAHHYADVRPPSSYAGKRVFIIGKRNSAFELASGLLQWAKTITLASPSPAKLSVGTKTLVGVRARYVQPFEDNALGGGCAILDAAIEKIERTDDALQVTVKRTADNEAMTLDADEVINATGFVTPLRDLPALGVAVFGLSRVPAQTDWWESATVPGIYFAGTVSQGAPALGKFGIPPNSAAVHGLRYNARILARRIAASEFGRQLQDRRIDGNAIMPLLIEDAMRNPALWHQRGYLARSIVADADGGFTDHGIVPLTTCLDGKDDGVFFAIEADGTGAIYPVAYVRKNGSLSERQLAPVGIASYDCETNRAAVAAALSPLLG